MSELNKKPNKMLTLIEQEKESGTPCWPTFKDPVSILAGFWEFAQRNRDDKKLMEVLGVGLEATLLQKIAAVLKRAADCGEDLNEIARLYDEVHETDSFVRDDVIVSVPGDDHNGVGFYPIEINSELQYLTDDDEWKQAWLTSLVPQGESLEVMLEDDPMADTILISKYLIRRPEPKKEEVKNGSK